MPNSSVSASPSSTRKSCRKRPLLMNDFERRSIRKYAQEHPETGQAGVIRWYRKTTGRPIIQSMVSRIMSDKYLYLDDHQPKTKAKEKKADYEELENALFEWQQMQVKKETVTGDILKAKASELWHLLPQYRDGQEPTWSNAWLAGFQERFDTRGSVREEKAEAEIDNPDQITQAEEICQLCQRYGKTDTFTVVELGLWWKLFPDQALAAQVSGDDKNSTDKVTLAMTTNADGSEKLDPWFIGRYENPRCLKGFDRRVLGVMYRSNKTKSMTGELSEEYLRWFNRQIGKRPGRKVLLLMGNFAGHKLAVETVGGLQGLPHVQIVWLPTNLTSFWQPFEQGIVLSFELHYRNQWVDFILQEYNADRQPEKTVTLLDAIRWTVEAWKSRVQPSTIEMCWQKTRCFGQSKPEDTQIVDQELIDELSHKIMSIPNPLGSLPIKDLMEPEEEAIVDKDGLSEAIAERRSPDTDIESEAEEPPKKIKFSEAIGALQCLREYEMQQLDSAPEVLDQIAKIEASIRNRGPRHNF